MSTIAPFEDAPMPVGFLLLAGETPVESTAARDCVFMTLPVALTSPGAAYLAQRKHQEFSVAVAVGANEVRISCECRPGERLEIVIPSLGRGTWSVVGGPDSPLSGSCEWAKGKQ